MTDFTNLQANALSDWESLNKDKKPLITVGNATCGRSAGSIDVMEAIRSETAAAGLDPRGVGRQP